MDYSTLARAEAAAHQQEDSASGHPAGDAAPGTLQRSRPLPISSDAGHLALAAEQAAGGDADGSSQGDWSDATSQPDSRGSAFGDIMDGSGAAHAAHRFCLQAGKRDSCKTMPVMFWRCRFGTLWQLCRPIQCQNHLSMDTSLSCAVVAE